MDRNETVRISRLAAFSGLTESDASIALSFYERKFTVYKLWSAPNPLNKMGQERKLLQIF